MLKLVLALLAATTIASPDSHREGGLEVAPHLDHVHIPPLHRSHRQRRAEPAIWGEPAPDYSMAKLDGTVTLLRALIYVEQKIVDFYSRDMTRVRHAILRMVRESNDYFYQINMRISVVDIRRTTENMTLYSFEEFRLSRLGELPEHDFAALVAFRYAGGLAFVGGMCTTKAVLYCGFYPHNPEAMGSIFFHEVAHLVGVPHAHKNDSIKVENCECSPEYLASVKPSVGCLKIPGYDHDCTAQQMANLVPRNRCLKRLADFDLSQLPASSFEHAICGNGIVEEGEDCDCGLETHCLNPNCRARSCRHVVPIWVVTLVALSICFFSVAVLVLYKKYVASTPLIKLRPLKTIGQLKSSLASMRSRVNTGESLQENLSRHKLDPDSIVVLLAADEKKPDTRKNLPRRGTLRPSQPPPPPPVSGSKTLPSTKLGPPPPRPPCGPTLVVNPMDNLPSTYEIPKHVRLRALPIKEEARESVTLSQKFEDFSDSDSEEPVMASRKERGSCFDALRGRRISSSADSASSESDLRTQSTDCASNSPSDESLAK
uniref:Peptidase M12B domain-containing protein n=1 Tax=Steinernema glaseri TaxID=37863 RepID=A0A1I7ZEP3_9BILA